jgi:tyrosinase
MLDRRAFLAASTSALATLGASPLQAQGAVVTRRSVRGMTANDPDLAAMRRAVAAMKALPASDPRNWARFADVHRNFCPHGNWYFLPWHRAYLLSFERAVRELSGKADFALPYWNWTLDRAFPAAFAGGDRDSNPLFHPRPGVEGGLRLADDMVGPQVISRVMASPDFEAFGSARPRGQDSTSSQWQRRLGAKTELEFNPHDGVHQSVGGNFSVVDLSARDPIFFLHHANIDRLWATWNARGNANSPEPAWRDFAFNGNFPGLANVRVGDVISPPALGYRYDDDDSPFAADVRLPSGDPLTEKLRAYRQLEARGLSRANMSLYRHTLATGDTIEVAAAENDRIASRDRPLAVVVPLGRPLGDILGPGALARSGELGDRRYRRYVWAVVRDIEPPLDVTTRVRVFANCTDLSPRTQITDPTYATSMAFFGSEHARHGAAGAGDAANGTSVCIDLTPSLARMPSLRQDRLTVQLLPHCANTESNVSNIRPRRVEIVIL